MTWNFHISLGSAVELLGLLIKHEKTRLKHGSGREVIVTAANHVDLWIWTNLHHLEVVGQTDLEVSFCLTIVNLALSYFSVIPIEHKLLKCR